MAGKFFSEIYFDSTDQSRERIKPFVEDYLARSEGRIELAKGFFEAVSSATDSRSSGKKNAKKRAAKGQKSVSKGRK